MANARIVEFLLAGIFDLHGSPASGGMVFSYDAGTIAPRPLYLDAAKVGEATNPVILNASGRAVVYGDGNYKFVIVNSAYALLLTVDNCYLQMGMPAHHLTHETGGADEATPIVHHTRHEPGGTDQINYPLASHHIYHEEGGADQITPPAHGPTHQREGTDEVTPAYHHVTHEPAGTDEITGVYDLVYHWFDYGVEIANVTTFSEDGWVDLDIKSYAGEDTPRAAVLTSIISILGPSTDGYYGGVEIKYRAKGNPDSSEGIRHSIITEVYNGFTYLRPQDSAILWVPCNTSGILQYRISDMGSKPPTSFGVVLYLQGYLY